MVFNKWTIQEKGIQTAEHVTCHMRNLILAAWPDEYYVELKYTTFEYDNVDPKDLLDHILTNYATMDESEIEDARQSIYKSPNFNYPINVYYKRQEELQEILSDAKVDIPNSELIRSFSKHIAATGDMFCEGTDEFRVEDVHLGVREDFLQLLLTFVVDVDGGIEVGTFTDGLAGVFDFGFIHGGVVGEYVVE